MVAVTLGAAADLLARQIPFAYERSLAERMTPPGPLEEHDLALTALADRLVAVMALPPEMTLNLHRVDDDAVNAGASLGGNVLVFRGLIERMPSENALAMVLAHEIAHIKLRHPVRSLGRGLVVALAASALFGVDADGAASTLMQGTGTLALLGFSRAQEREADALAIAAVNALYGHVGGAVDAYRVLLDAVDGEEPPPMLSTHPHTAERIATLEAFTAASGIATRAPQPLGAEFLGPGAALPE